MRGQQTRGSKWRQSQCIRQCPFCSSPSWKSTCIEENPAENRIINDNQVRKSAKRLCYDCKIACRRYTFTFTYHNMPISWLVVHASMYRWAYLSLDIRSYLPVEACRMHREFSLSATLDWPSKMFETMRQFKSILTRVPWQWGRAAARFGWQLALSTPADRRISFRARCTWRSGSRDSCVDPLVTMAINVRARPRSK